MKYPNDDDDGYNDNYDDLMMMMMMITTWNYHHHHHHYSRIQNQKKEKIDQSIENNEKIFSFFFWLTKWKPQTIIVQMQLKYTHLWFFCFLHYFHHDLYFIVRKCSISNWNKKKSKGHIIINFQLFHYWLITI